MSNSSVKNMFGKYRLLAHLANGGMAEVLLASHTGLANFEKLVVLKLILPHLSKEKRFIDMFLDEARIAAKLNHPNVVQVFDLGVEDGRYFIAMEYLPGESLSYLVRTMRKQGRALPAHLAAGIVMQAADGLYHAHSAVDNTGKPLRIVHRDISPQNIFVLYDGGVKVVDFGIAKATLNTTKTRTGTLKGKYAYMSPEQILGKELDARSDLFSLGVVLWECLTGRKLFTEQSDLKLLQSITDGDIPSPVEVDPKVPWDLSNIAMKALEKDPKARFQSARHMRQSLYSYLKNTEDEADTVAIARFMHEHCTERIKKKQQLIKGAQEDCQDLHQALFGDLNSILSDTEQSIPRTPLDKALVAQKPAKDPVPPGLLEGSVEESSSLVVLPKRPVMPYVLLGVFLVMVFSGIVFFLGDGDSPDKAVVLSGPSMNEAAEKPDAGSGELDASVLSVYVRTDGGKDDVNSKVGDVHRKDVKREFGKQSSEKKRKKRTNNKHNSHNPTFSVQHPVVDTKPDRHGGPKEQEAKSGREHNEQVAIARQAGAGTLRLTTDPWVDVYLDGKKIGQTPLVDVVVPAGNIKMRAVNKEAGVDRFFFVRIRKDKRTTKRLNFF